MTLKTSFRTSLPTVTLEITKFCATLWLNRPIYVMNSTMENATDANADEIVSQASLFLSFKIGKALEDIIPSNSAMVYLILL